MHAVTSNPSRAFVRATALVHYSFIYHGYMYCIVLYCIALNQVVPLQQGYSTTIVITMKYKTHDKYDDNTIKTVGKHR